MKLYVGTYGKYNAGSIDGAWLDLDDYSDKEEFLEACAKLHNEENDPEFMFQDFEAENSIEEEFYCESYISEKYWTEYKDAIEDCHIDLDIVGEYINLHGLDIVDGIKQAEDCYCGTFDSEEDFAETEVLECYPDIEKNLPNFVFNSIDWKHIAFELSFDYDYIRTSTYDIAVFRKY